MKLPRRFVLLFTALGLMLALAPATASAAPCVSGQTGPALGDATIFTPPPIAVGADEYCTLVDLTGCTPDVQAHWELYWPTGCTIPVEAFFRDAVEGPPGCFKPGAQVGPAYAYSLAGVTGLSVDHVSPQMAVPGSGRYFICISMTNVGNCALGNPMASPRIRLDGGANLDACTSYNVVGGVTPGTELLLAGGNPVMYVSSCAGGASVTGQTGPAIQQTAAFFTPPNDEICTFVDLQDCLSGTWNAHWSLYWPDACTIPAEAYFRAAVPAGPDCYTPGDRVGPAVSYSLVGIASQNVEHVSPPLADPGPGKWFICVKILAAGDCPTGSPLPGPRLALDASNEACQSYNLTNDAPGEDLSGLPGNPVMFVTRTNQAPDCSGAVASTPVLWYPNHKYRPISILGVTDADGDAVTITVTGVMQDEPVNGKGDGNTCPDAKIVNGQVSVRAERARSHHANGRVYVISFTASDGRGGTCNGTVEVCVPANHRDDHDDHDDHGSNTTPVCVNDGATYSSTEGCRRHHNLDREDDDELSLDLEVGEVANNQAQLTFALPSDGQVDVAVFDIAGRRVATIEHSTMTSGVYDRVWRMDGVPKGLYFIRMHTLEETLTQRVLKLH